MTDQHRAVWSTLGEHRVRHLESGSRSRTEPEIVLVPGLGALGYLHDTLHGCAARTRAHLLDLPGLGHAGPRHDADVRHLADLAAAWLAAVPAGPVVLAGHSTGAQVALHAAVRAPERVVSLVLLGLTFPPRLRTLAGLARAVPGDAIHERPSVLLGTAPYYARDPRAVWRLLRSGQRDAPERVIPEVTCPVLLASGEHDTLSPRKWLDELAASARKARVVTVPGAHTFPQGRGGMTAALIDSGH